MSLLLVCALAPALAQHTFPYPSMPDTLRTVEQRAAYLSTHYWDNFDFADTLALQDKELAEQGFVNFIDMLSRFDQQVAQKGITAFTAKAYVHAASKEKFENLIEEYCADNKSPLRNDLLYGQFLKAMKTSSCFDETEKERIDFKLKATLKHLPGDIASDFSFTLADGKPHHLSDYKDKRVILYFYDPDCENCHKIEEWFKKQTIPTNIEKLNIVANMPLSSLYDLKEMPTIYLLDKGNIVRLKDCTPEQLMQEISR